MVGKPQFQTAINQKAEAGENQGVISQGAEESINTAPIKDLPHEFLAKVSQRSYPYPDFSDEEERKEALQRFEALETTQSTRPLPRHRSEEKTAAQTYQKTSAASGSKVEELVRDSADKILHVSSSGNNNGEEVRIENKVDGGLQGLGRGAGGSGEMGWTADLNTINFYLFKGKRDFSQPFRVSKN